MPIRLPQCAGKKYRPSNGTEGEIFMETFCDHCKKCPACSIPGLTMGMDTDDPNYPQEWKFDSDGVPTCTAFEDSRK
jgi:hypothetical protein